MGKAKLHTWFIAIYLSGFIFSSGQIFAANKNTFLGYAAHITGDSAHTHIAIDFNLRPKFSVHYADNPIRIIVTLPGTSLNFPPDSLKPHGLFSDIQYATPEQRNAQIILTSKIPMRLVVAKLLDINGGTKHRLILDAEKIPSRDFNTILNKQNQKKIDLPFQHLLL